MALPHRDEGIHHPSQLNIPSQAEADKVFGRLTQQGREDFLNELLHAVLDSKRTGSLWQIQFVVDSWYRSMQLYEGLGPEQIDASIARIATVTSVEEPMSLQDALSRLGDTD